MDIQFAPNVEVNIMPESAPIRQGGMSRTAAVVTLTAPDGRQARCWLAATIDECGRPVFYATALGRSDKSDRSARLVGAWHDFEARSQQREDRPMRTRWYVGHLVGNVQKLEAFTSVSIPTERTHGDKYALVVGPFRTKRAALWAERYGGNSNPHFRHVNDAERYAKRAAVDAAVAKILFSCGPRARKDVQP